MGYLEDHVNAVIKRQAQKLLSGESEESVRKHLEYCHWKPNEIDIMVEKAKQICNKK